MLNDTDWDLLEAYLDDAMSSAEVQRLDGRLTQESELSDALDGLRRQRALRIGALQFLTPDDSHADAFAGRVLESLRARELRRRWGMVGRIAVGLAACLLVGFSLGRMGRGGIAIAPQTKPQPAPHADVHLAVHAPKPAEPGQYQVAVLDDSGRVIAVQRFARIEEAHQFANDLAQYEVRRQQVQDSQAMLVSDRF